MVEHEAGQRLAAGPGKRPKGRGQPRTAVEFFGDFPQRDRVVRLIRPNLRYERHRRQPGVPENE